MFVRNKHTQEENEYIMTVEEMKDMFSRVITGSIESKEYMELIDQRISDHEKPLLEKITALENTLKAFQVEMNLPDLNFKALAENAGAIGNGSEAEVPLY